MIQQRRFVPLSISPPVFLPPFCGLYWSPVLFFLATPRSLSPWSLWSLVSFPSSPLKRRWKGPGNERVRWDNWSVFLERGKEDDVWYCPYSSFPPSLLLLCGLLRLTFPFLSHPSISILGFWHPHPLFPSSSCPSVSFPLISGTTWGQNLLSFQSPFLFPVLFLISAHLLTNILINSLVGNKGILKIITLNVHNPNIFRKSIHTWDKQ